MGGVSGYWIQHEVCFILASIFTLLFQLFITSFAFLTYNRALPAISPPICLIFNFQQWKYLLERKEIEFDL